MHKKHFLVLLVLVAMIGGIGLAMFSRDRDAWRSTDDMIGKKLLPSLALDQVAQVYLKNKSGELTLVKQDTGWVIKERDNFPAEVQLVGEFVIKLREAKIGQTEPITEKQRPRVELADPSAKEGSGTIVELRDKAGKPIQTVILGKKHLGKPAVNVVGFDKGQPDGRYVLLANKPDTVLVINDPLNNAETAVEKWVMKEIVKIDRIRTMDVAAPDAANSWKLSRAEEFGQWTLAGSTAEKTNASTAVAATNALGKLEFIDIANAVKPDQIADATTITIDTYDDFSYVLRIGRKPGSEDYLVNIVAKGEPPKERKPEKNEKPEDKEKLDKQFEDQKKLTQLKLAQTAIGGWVFVMGKDVFKSVLRPKADFVEQPRKPGDAKGGAGGLPPGFPGMPGMPGMPR